MGMRRIGLGLLLIVSLGVQTFAHAEGLSMQQILDLKSAGIGDAVIVHQIEASGVSFQPDAAALLNLRKAGASDSLLDAVAKAGTSKSGSSQQGQDKLAGLYQAGKFADVADELSTKEKDGSLSDREYATLVLSLIRLQQYPQAQSTLDRFGAKVPGSPYLVKLSTVLKGTSDRLKLRDQLAKALQDLSAAEFQDAAQHAPLSGLEHRMLLSNAALLTGDFEAAKLQLNSDGSETYRDRVRMKKALSLLSEQTSAYDAARKVVDFHLHSKIAHAYCRADGMGVAEAGKWLPGISIPKYIEAVRVMVNIAPLNPDAERLAFHAALISQRYDKIQALGDRLLATTGSVRVPFAASNAFFDVVIDQKSRRVHTEINNAPLADGTAMSKESNVADLEPFDLAYDEIKGIDQLARDEISVMGFGLPYPWMVHYSYALKFSPKGVAPIYGLMLPIHCIYGQEAQKEITNNLGRYIQHVVGLPDTAVKLVAPGRSGGGLGTVMVGVGMALGAPGASAVAEQVSSTEAAQSVAETTWLEFKQASDVLSVELVPPSEMDDIESVLGLASSAS